MQLYNGNGGVNGPLLAREGALVLKQAAFRAQLAPSMDTNWHHVALTQDAARLTAYYDGTPSLVWFSLTVAACDYLRLGNFSGVPSFKGRMAQFQIHDRVFAAGEVTQLMAGTRPAI